MNLKRYNEILIALALTAGTLAILGNLAWNLMPRGQDYTPPGVAVQAPNLASGGSPPAQRLVLCPPAFASGSEWQYVPLVSVLPGNEENAVLGSSGIYAAKRIQYDRPGPNALDTCDGIRDRQHSVVFNVLIRHGGTGEQHLLLRSPAVVASLQLPDAKCAVGEGNVPCGTLLWTLFDRDSNHDGFLNAKDAGRLYASDLAGEHLRALTPEGNQVLSWQWHSPADELLISVRRDANGDGALDDTDGAELLFSHGDPLTVATPVIDPVILRGLQNVLHQP
jgi:hypothetical protein